MKLTLFTLGGSPPLIRPAPAERDWMDASAQRFAYRCLPLNIANAHGWELLCPGACEAVWDGGAGKEAVRISGDDAGLPVSHFGKGIVTFHVNALFRTEPGVDLWVGGPINRPKPGISPLTGIIETDWAPYTFTMNWQLTEAGRPVRFAAGEPFCSLFPIRPELVEACEPEIRSIEDDPELAADFRAWADSRRRFGEQLAVTGSTARDEAWQKHYFRGLRPDGTQGPEHRTRLRPKPFPGAAPLARPPTDDWPAGRPAVAPLVIPGFLNAVQLAVVHRLVASHAPSGGRSPTPDPHAVRLLQQARLVAARAVARHFRTSGPLYDGGLRVERWSALRRRAADRAGPFEFEAFFLVEPPQGEARATLSVDGLPIAAPAGSLVAFPVTDRTAVEPSGDGDDPMLVRLGLTGDPGRVDAASERIY